MKIRNRIIGLCCSSLLLFSMAACDLVGQEQPAAQTAPTETEQTESAAVRPAENGNARQDDASGSGSGQNESANESENANENDGANENKNANENEGANETEGAVENEEGSGTEVSETVGEPEEGQTPPEEETTGTETAPEEETGAAEPTQDPAPETEQPVEETPAETVTPPASAGVEAFELSGPAMLGETADQGQSYIDSMIFLGDSTTYGMKYYAVLSGGKNTQQVWTPSNGTLTLSQQGFASIVYPPDGTEIPIRDAVSKALPEYMVITLGVNGVSFMDEEYFKSEYLSLVTDIQSLSPNTKIILQSIFPVASNYEYLSSINNEKISAANHWVMEIAEECNVRYLNTASVLVGADGWLPQNLQNGDGLHLNEIGFGIVLDYIRTHGYQ